MTWSWFCGIAPKDEATLRARAKSWTRPAQITGAQYLPRQAAYQVEAGALQVEPGRPAVRPTFLLPGEKATIRPEVDGALLPPEGYAVGIERTLAGVQTVVTLKQDLAAASRIELH